MPSTYAHYRFGMQALTLLPPQVQRSINRFLPLYQVGLHGPDLFYFYSPLSKTRIGGMADRYHHAAGRVMFEEAADRLDFTPSEGAMVYLFGVLAHFCLDRLCHPLINGWASEEKAGHSEIESEFDRYLLEKDGRTPPHTQKIGTHLHLRWPERQSAAEVYDHVSSAQLCRALTNMRVLVALAQAPEGWRRQIAGRILSLSGKNGQDFIMCTQANPRCSWANEPLEAGFRQALDEYPSMLQELVDYFEHKTPLGDRFDLIFG